MMKSERFSEEFSSNRISVYVDSYVGKTLSGTVMGFAKEERQRFTGLFDLFIFIENSLDRCGIAEPYTGYKTFAPTGMAEKPDKKNDDHEPVKAGELLATFHIKVLFRQNASWQGTVLWQEGKSEVTFRSALELVFLMDSALSGVDSGRAFD